MAKKNGRRWKKTVIGFVGNNTKGKQEKKFYSTWRNLRNEKKGKQGNKFYSTWRKLKMAKGLRKEASANSQTKCG
jgi:hypothetical protein